MKVARYNDDNDDDDNNDNDNGDDGGNDHDDNDNDKLGGKWLTFRPSAPAESVSKPLHTCEMDVVM